MLIPTKNLTGPALDYAVAQCEGRTIRRDPMKFYDGSYWIWEETPSGKGGIDLYKSVYMQIGKDYSPSTQWAQGGPIIGRESITLRTNAGVAGHWAAFIDFGSSNTAVKARQSGPTPLIAAMRCYVASRFGETVDVPDVLASGL